MDPMHGEKLNYEEEESQTKQQSGGGAISAPADQDELIGDDDEYDELYGDLNVGEGFLQFQLSQPEVPGDQIADAVASNFEEINTSQKAMAPDAIHDSEALKLGFDGSIPVAQNDGIDPVDMSGKAVNESVPLLNPKPSVHQDVSQKSPNHLNDNVNMNCQFANDHPIRTTGDNGTSRIFVGALDWWTTDAEIESVSSIYGRVKEVKFFEEKSSGRSKGHCLVEFYDSAAAAACKEGMNGYNFNGRACTVAFASPHTARQMFDTYKNISRVQPQSQSQPQGRRPLNENAVVISCGTNYPAGDHSGRGYGRGGWARGQGSGGGNWRSYGRPWGIGPSMGPNVPAPPRFGAGPSSGVFMHPAPMMGAGFDAAHMVQGLPVPSFPGMIHPNFQNVNAAFHPVNPAFFGRGMAPYGMGMMGHPRMYGPANSGILWNDPNTGGGRPEPNSPRTSESNSGSEENSGQGSPEQGSQRTRQSSLSSETNAGGGRPEQGSLQRTRESSFQGSDYSDNRPHYRSGRDREMYEREHRYRDREYMKHGYRDHQYRDHRYREREDRERGYREHHRYREEKDRYSAYKDDYDRGQSSAGSRSRSRFMEEASRSRSRDADKGKRRRLPSE